MTTEPRRVPRDDGRPLQVLLRRPLRIGLAGLAAVALTAILVAAAVLGLGMKGDRVDVQLSGLQDGHIAMLDQESGLRGFLVTRQDHFLQLYKKGAADLARVNAQRESASDATADGSDELAEGMLRLAAAQDAWITGWAQPVLLSQPQIGDTAAIGDLFQRNKALFDEYRAVYADVRGLVQTQLHDIRTQQQLVLVGGAFLKVALAAVVAVVVRRAGRRLARQLLPPTRQVRDTLAALAAGDVGRRAPEVGPAELHDIAADVNVLGQALGDQKVLVAARERELVAARDQAEQAGQAKAAFLATMSHEIRTPLNAVLGLTDILLMTELTDEQRGYLDTMSGSGDSLLALINDILDFSKIEAGELDLEAAPFDLHALVYDVAQLLATQAAGKSIDLLVDVVGDCPVLVIGDGARLRQVLINLVGNAVKFTGQGQVLITLGGEVTGSRLACRIAVADTGIGIPPDQLHRLFRSFTQVDTSPTRSYGGTGLGLAISQRITRAMGGDIAVQSEPGLGSTFTVTVELGVAAAGDERRSPGDLAGLRLLVVDDNPTNLRILEDQVTGLGGQCVLAAGGAAALEHLDADVGPFDACLLDLHMPGMNGDELAARLRAHPATATVPLVLLSSSNRLHAGGGPFAARLHKPIRPERLLRTLLSTLPPRHSGARRRPTDVVTPSEAPVMPGRLRVLVAEDQAVNAHLMALYLQQLGHDSDHVDNGERAVEAARTGNFDVVLMDAQMPVLGGVGATAAIRCLSGPQPRIIAVTASVLPADRAAFLAAGADEFLTKPVRLSTLRESLSRWTDGAGQADAPAEPVDVSDVGQVGAPSDAGGALDPETVEQLRDLGAANFQHLYQQYVDGLQSTVEALLSAVDDTSWSEEDETSVPRLAHRLKGSSAAMGAQRMAGLCQRLVEIDPGSPDLEGALNALLAESRAVLSAVAALSAPGSAGPGRGGPRHLPPGAIDLRPVREPSG